MQLSITGRNVDITEYTRGYVEKKMQRVLRHLPGLTESHVELAVENTKGAEQRNVAQVTLRAGGKIIRAEERSSDLFTAVDAVMDRVVRQADRFKGKRQTLRKRTNGLRENVEAFSSETVLTAEPLSAEELENFQPIVRTKRFQTAPMEPDEAIEQMELLGHSFFVFYNSQDGQVNVVYRRNDGTYGLLIPEIA